MEMLHIAAAAAVSMAILRAALRMPRLFEGLGNFSPHETFDTAERRFYLVVDSFQDADVDIVFINDIQNSRPANRPPHPQKDEIVSWLRDNLPETEKARILVYYYDTTLRSSEYLTRRTLRHEAVQLNNRLIDARAHVVHKDRPIIFVAHSLGGILLKNALIMSEMSRKNNERSILVSTATCLFLNTPHQTSADLLCESIWDAVQPRLDPIQTQTLAWQRSNFIRWARVLVHQTQKFEPIAANMPREPQYIRSKTVEQKEIDCKHDSMMIEALREALSSLRESDCQVKCNSGRLPDGQYSQLSFDCLVRLAH